MKKKYRVKKGENFFSIAEKLYGNSAYAATLIWANPGIYVLHPGMILKTPQIDTSTGELPVMGNAAWARIKEADRRMRKYEHPNMAKISKEVYGGENTIRSLPEPEEVGFEFVEPYRIEAPEDYNPYMQLDGRLKEKLPDKLVKVMYPDELPPDFEPPEMLQTSGGDLREYPVPDEAWTTYYDDEKWREKIKERIRDALFPEDGSDEEKEGGELKGIPPDANRDMAMAFLREWWKSTDDAESERLFMELRKKLLNGQMTPVEVVEFLIDLIERREAQAAKWTPTLDIAPMDTSPDQLFDTLFEIRKGLGDSTPDTEISFVQPEDEKEAAKSVLDAWLASVIEEKTLDYRTKQLAKEGYKRALMAIESGKYTLEEVWRIYGSRLQGYETGGALKPLYKPAPPADPKREAMRLLTSWWKTTDDDKSERHFLELRKQLVSGKITPEDVIRDVLNQVVKSGDPTAPLMKEVDLFIRLFEDGRVSTMPYTDAVLEEYFVLYTIGAPAEGAYMREPVIVAHAGFGYGLMPWQDYYQVYTDGSIEEVAQYLAPGLIITEEDRRAIIDGTGDDVIFSTHYNLCGQLSVIAAMGLDFSEGLKTFALIEIEIWDKEDLYGILKEEDRTTYNEFTRGSYILRMPGMTTSYATLENFIEDAGGSEVSASHMKNGTKEALLDLLVKGEKLISLVNIDGNGKLVPYDDVTKPIAHWVWVQDMITTKSGEILVRLYNPFMNREEVYTWKAFTAAWDTTGYLESGKKKKNSNHYQGVVISYGGD